MPRVRSARPSVTADDSLHPHTLRTSFLRRLVEEFLLLTSFTVVSLGLLSFLVAASVVENRATVRMADQAAYREDRIEQASRQDRERTALLALRPELRDALAAPAVLDKTIGRLWEELRREQVNILGITVFSDHREVIGAIGEHSPALFVTDASTALVPFVDPKSGWLANDVYSPILFQGNSIRGYLALRFDAGPTLSPVLSTITLGRTGRVILGTQRGGEVIVLHQSSSPRSLQSYTLGGVRDGYLRALPLTEAVQGQEGAGRLYDERGKSVIAAYRFIPSLGLGIAVQVQRSEALAGLSILAIAIFAISLLFLVLSGILGRLLAHRIVSPLLRLSRNLSALRPGHWRFPRSVRTGDELEMIDEAISDLSRRVERSQETLEATVLKRTRELKNQMALDHAMLQSIEYGILTVDARGILTRANPAACRLLLLSPEGILGKKAPQILSLFERKKECKGERHPVSIALKSRQPFRSHPTRHMTILRADKTSLPVTLLAVPLLDDERLLGAMIVFQDMTMERQIDYMKSEFIALASHQLRTPLSSLRWYLELLGSERKGTLTPSEKSYLTEMEHASKRMANLLESLLHVAQIEGGGIVPEPQDVNLAALLHRMTAEWRTIAAEKGLRLTAKIPHAALTVPTDPVLLQVVIQNFLTNAFKYSPKGTEIVLSLDGDKKEARINVQDHGVGIPTDARDRVFQKFFRAENVRKLDTDGTGLGLYMSKTLIENLGGKITFKSEEGKGTTFTVHLPR